MKNRLLLKFSLHGHVFSLWMFYLVHNFISKLKLFKYLHPTDCHCERTGDRLLPMQNFQSIFIIVKQDNVHITYRKTVRERERKKRSKEIRRRRRRRILFQEGCWNVSVSNHKDAIKEEISRNYFQKRAEKSALVRPWEKLQYYLILLRMVAVVATVDYVSPRTIATSTKTFRQSGYSNKRGLSMPYLFRDKPFSAYIIQRSFLSKNKINEW